MIQKINHVFNIRSGEWRRLLLLYVLALLINVGWIWSFTYLQAAFSRQVGVEFLAWFSLIRGALSIIAIALYSVVVDQITHERLLAAILGISALGMLVGMGLLALGQAQLAYPLLFFLTFVPYNEILATHWFTYASSFYDTRSAKRILPILDTSFATASVIGGLTIAPLSYALSSFSVTGLWLATALISIVLIRAITRVAPAGHGGPQARTSAHSSSNSWRDYVSNLREGTRFVVGSGFLRWVALARLLTTMLIVLLQYQTWRLLLDELATVEAMTGFTGMITAVGNLIVLPIQLFLLSRLVGLIGLANATLIYPISTLLLSGLLFLLPNQFTLALVYFGHTGLFYALASLNALLYNAVPASLKGRARAFIVGLVTPIGTLFGGGLLLLLQSTTLAWLLPACLIVLAGAYVGTALMVRQRYAQALVEMLARDDFSFLVAREATRLPTADAATLRELRRRFEESSSPDFAIFMAQLLSEIGGDEAVPILVQAVRNSNEEQVRAAITDVLVAMDTRSAAALQLYIDLLADPSQLVRLSAIDGLAQRYEDDDATLLTHLHPLLHDPASQVQARVLPVHLRARDATYRAAGQQLLTELLGSPDPDLRRLGVEVLGLTETADLLMQVIGVLSDPSDEVRLQAATVIEGAVRRNLLPAEQLAPFTGQLEQLCRDPIERVRQAALVVLSSATNQRSHQALVAALTDQGTLVREVAVERLVAVGEPAVPALLAELKAAEPLRRKMATVVLSQINHDQFGGTIKTYIYDNLVTIYRNYAYLEALAPCVVYSSSAVLLATLQEQNEQLLDEIFYLLAAVHSDDAIRVIRDALLNADAYTRANGVEALEALTTPQTAGLIAPLFEPEANMAQKLQLRAETWGVDSPDTAGALRQIVTDPHDPWLHAVAVVLLGESVPSAPPALSTTPPAPAPAEVAPEQDNRSTAAQRRRRAAALFDKLNEPAPEAASEQAAAEVPPEQDAQPTAAQRRRRAAALLDKLSEPAPDAPEQSGDPAAAEAPPEPGSRPTATQRRNRVAAIFDRLAEPAPTATPAQPGAPVAPPMPLPLNEVIVIVQQARHNPAADVQAAALTVARSLGLAGSPALSTQETRIMLSVVEKIIFLKGVPFFKGMTIEQLKVVATVCEERFYATSEYIFQQGESGGSLYVIVNGRIAIEQERRKGSFARLATLDAHAYFGEATLFDNSPRSASAMALQDSLILRLGREPMIALARQYPDLSLKLINVLSERLREANDRVAELTRTRPRELQKFFDQF